jgi:hypothetical protein
MKIGFVIISAVLISGPAFAAEPAKPANHPTTEAQNVDPPVVFASAEDVRQPPAADPQAPATPKRRPARVTTCRCGDPAPPSNQ